MSTNVIRQAPCPDCRLRQSRGLSPWTWCETCYGSGYVPLIAKPQPSGKALLRAALIFGLAFLIGVLLVLRQLRLI
jgi:hypothetical protein